MASWTDNASSRHISRITRVSAQTAPEEEAQNPELWVHQLRRRLALEIWFNDSHLMLRILRRDASYVGASGILESNIKFPSSLLPTFPPRI